MGKYDESNGVWRTVGGRRIFIKDGEDLSTAMKKSGKFKTHTEKTEEKLRKSRMDLARSYSDEELEDEIQTYKDKKDDFSKKRLAELEHEKEEREAQAKARWFEKNDPDSDVEVKKAVAESSKGAMAEADATDRRVRTSDIENATGMKVKKTFDTDAFGNGKETRFQLEDGSTVIHSTESLGKKEDSWSVQKFENGSIKSKNYESYNDMIKDMKNSSRSTNDIMNEKIRGVKSNNVTSQKSDIEKNSGLKVKKAFETDAFGNGKEDRFQLEDGRTVIHSKEALGSKDDSWSVSEFKDGSTKSTSYKSYDEMLKGLKDKSSNTAYEKGYSQKELNNVWKNEDYSEVISGLKNSEINKMRQAAYDMDTTTPGTPGYNNAKEYLQKMENKAATQFLDRQKSVKEKVTSHNAYKKAFEDYKKKHPNSKLSLNQFIDMSEGK